MRFTFYSYISEKRGLRSNANPKKRNLRYSANFVQKYEKKRGGQIQAVIQTVVMKLFAYSFLEKNRLIYYQTSSSLQYLQEAHGSSGRAAPAHLTIFL